MKVPRRVNWSRLLPPLAAWIVLLLFYVFAGLRDPDFFGYYTARNIVAGAAVLGILAVGMNLVILSGGIDLSVGAIVGFTSILIAVLLEQGWSPPVAWAVALAFGAGIGVVNGGIIHLFGLPPFIVTLGAMFVVRGSALLISERSVAITHPLYERLGLAGAGDFPPVVFILVAVVVFGWAISRWTRFGRTVYALGSRESSARLMGLPVASTRLRVYAFSGLCAAIAGIALTIATQSGRATEGQLAELDAIAAVVIGGTPLTGGVGVVPGALAGALIASLIQEVITFIGVSNSWWTRIAVGGLLLAFILLQRIIHARADRGPP